MGEAPQKGAHILLVDDDDIIRMMASESLRHADFVVSEATSAEEALALFEKHDFQLVLLDVVMPGLNGYQVCEAIRQYPHGARVPIVMMTGLSDTESIEQAYLAGATDFITKPINWFLLIQRVRYVLRTRQAMEDVWASQRSLAAAQRMAKMGSWEWSVQEPRFSCSDAMKEMFNFPQEVFDMKNPEVILQFIRESDREALRQAHVAVLRDGTPYQLTYGVPLFAGGIREVFEQGMAIRNDAGEIVKIEGIMQDISERVEAQRQIDYLSMHDSLTGLANRTFFRELAAAELERVRRQKHSAVLLVIDIDHFKMSNDALGSAAGDQILRTVAQRLRGVVRSDEQLSNNPLIQVLDTIARVSGDTFMALVTDLQQPEQAEFVVRRMQEAIGLPMMVNDQEILLTASVGMAVFPRDAQSIEGLSQNAEKALDAAKAMGVSGYCFFSEDMNESARNRLLVANEMRQAINNNELLLHYQPKVDASSRRIIGAEALVRWNHPEMGLLHPGTFIPMAEELGMILDVGDWVFDACARQLRQWLDAGLDPGRVAVNLASDRFKKDDLVNQLVQSVDRAGLSPDHFMLELTESQLMGDTELSIGRLYRLRDAGFGLSLDDFGTGYSSLSYLHSFPIDELKIDRSFVNSITKGRRESAIARSVIELGRQFEMSVVAEGVETLAQAGFLLEHGCPVQQGFLYSRPIPAEEFERVLRNSAPLFDH